MRDFYEVTSRYYQLSHATVFSNEQGKLPALRSSFLTTRDSIAQER
jgi:hypothetical protein